MALADAKVDPSEIGYVNAHGTSTNVNDKVETKAVKGGFGEAAKCTPVSSIKSMVGHLIAAAGSVGSNHVPARDSRWRVPPTINYSTPDPECDLDYIPNEAREVQITKALSNSFGFGGQNISLIFSNLPLNSVPLHRVPAGWALG